MTNPFEAIEKRLISIELMLIELKHSEPQSVPEPEIFTVEKAANFLGTTAPAVRGLAHRRKIPFSKRGKRLYFQKSELLDWLKSGRQKTLSESELNPEGNLKPMKRRATV